MRHRFARSLPTAALVMTFVLAAAGPAQAYVGPGLGLGAIAVVFGLIASVFVAIFAIFWYPVKRRLRRRKAPGEPPSSSTG